MTKQEFQKAVDRCETLVLDDLMLCPIIFNMFNEKAFRMFGRLFDPKNGYIGWFGVTGVNNERLLDLRLWEQIVLDSEQYRSW